MYVLIQSWEQLLYMAKIKRHTLHITKAILCFTWYMTLQQFYMGTTCVALLRQEQLTMSICVNSVTERSDVEGRNVDKVI